MHDEKRNRMRLPFEAPALVQAGTTGVVAGAMLKDISIDSLYLATEKKIPVGYACDVEVVLSGRTSSLTLHVQGKVVRQDSSGLAVQFFNDLEWWALFPIFARFGRPGKGEKAPF
jgi:hypothetical protein